MAEADRVPGKVLPDFVFFLDVPTWPEDVSKRDHNRFAKESLSESMMEVHHRKHIPLHFKRQARSRYGYLPRDWRYVKQKQRRWGQGGMDLVKTGLSREHITDPANVKLRLGGTAEKQNLKATMTFRFPWKGGTGRFRKSTRSGRPRSNKISADRMIDEMKTVIPEENRAINDDFGKRYMGRVETKRASSQRRRIRKKA